MSATDYNDLSRHLGHKVEVVSYAEVNVAIECEDCSEVLLDFDKNCEAHTWVLQMNIANTPTQNYCEECGATEPADPDDIAEQQRLLATCNCAELDDDLIEAGNTCYNCYATNKDVSRLEN